MVRFHNHHTFFLRPERDHFPKKNVLHQFKDTVNQEVIKITHYKNDRGIVIAFGNSYLLHIQCFGRRSAIYLVKDNQVIDSFKDLNPKDTLEPAGSDLVYASEISEFVQSNRFITEEIISILNQRNFFATSNPQQSWLDFLEDFNAKNVFINRAQDQAPAFSIEQGANTIESYSNIIDAFHDFARLFLAYSRQAQLKQRLLQETNKTITQLAKRVKKLVKALEKLKNRPDFKQIGDILMANLYAIEPNRTEVELDNFYTGDKIKVALKRDLNPQKNAERYYQKSKNAHLEVQHTERQLNSVRQEILQLESKRSEIEQSTGHKELQQLDKQRKLREPSIKEIKQLPYKHFSFQGFDIWVGKSAKANDDLLKLAHKNDTWLHARGVAGSHVLLKNPEGKPISEPLLEYAASLAAKFSKSQNDSLAAVIYTSPKHVRKFKGALPGQVRVDREEVILVEPAI